MEAAAPWAITVAMKTSTWLFPVVETLHIWGFVVLVGSVGVLDVRVLGLGRSLSVRELAAHTLPWSLGAMLLVMPTGFLLFLAQSEELLASPLFLVKLALIGLAACNALIFHTGPYQDVAEWDRGVAAPQAARISCALSLAIWFSVIACGRFLAYV